MQWRVMRMSAPEKRQELPSTTAWPTHAAHPTCTMADSHDADDTLWARTDGTDPTDCRAAVACTREPETIGLHFWLET